MWSINIIVSSLLSESHWSTTLLIRFSHSSLCFTELRRTFFKPSNCTAPLLNVTWAWRQMQTIEQQMSFVPTHSSTQLEAKILKKWMRGYSQQSVKSKRCWFNSMQWSWTAVMFSSDNEMSAKQIIKTATMKFIFPANLKFKLINSWQAFFLFIVVSYDIEERSETKSNVRAFCHLNLTQTSTNPCSTFCWRFQNLHSLV